jgi:predicted phosphodiesterase
MLSKRTRLSVIVVGVLALIAAVADTALAGSGPDANTAGRAAKVPNTAGGDALVSRTTPPTAATHLPEPTLISEPGRWIAPRRAKRSVVWALGDAANGGPDSRRVATMLAERRVDRLIYLGDVYNTGTAAEFAQNYAPAFGRFARRTVPVIGNHERRNWDQGYGPYWEGVHGSPPPLYYASRASGWQLLSLNSEDPHDSEQLSWLRGKLRRSSRFGDCRIASWHRPRYSAGRYGDDHIEPLWRALAGRARIALAGHDHTMQRLRRTDGITSFISGAGGGGLYYVDGSDPRLRFGNETDHGALRLRLSRGRAAWRFVSSSGEVLDSGRLRCRRG